MLVSADKTTNFYSVSKDEYKKLRTENITEKYKKADKSTVREINLEAKNIAKSLNIQDRVQCMAQKHAFITLKDHKDNFASHPTCRLINPAKSEIGIISKKILERVILEVKSAENLRQWRNTADVIGWFRGIRKRRATFMKFDIKEFYPNISEDLLKKSLNYAKQFTELSVQEEHIILHACKSLLFDDNAAWVKQKGGLFDIGMGSYHGAEVCELVGLFLLSKITTLFGVNKVGLYRDDGLAVLNGISDQGTDNMRKDLEKIFTDEGLGISVDTNLRITDFLDITLNLDTGKYYPYRKPNNLPLYVHKKSNHPPSIIKQLPLMINKRMSDISYDKEEFDKSKPMYEKALRESGYSHKLEYITPTSPPARNRRRKIIWFNPPFCRSVKTNVGKLFLKLVKKHFPRHHRYYKIFNKNTVKISYSCLDNMASKISQHNKKVINPPPPPPARLCNCSDNDKPNCPLQGECLLSSIVYKASVNSVGNETMHYYGLCETAFKQRWYNHRSAINAVEEEKAKRSELSKYVWHLNQNNVPNSITWEVAARAKPFQCSNMRCYLCLNEKLAIALADQSTMLNKRTEIVSKCRHKNKFLLKNVK